MIIEIIVGIEALSVAKTYLPKSANHSYISETIHEIKNLVYTIKQIKHNFDVKKQEEEIINEIRKGNVIEVRPDGSVYQLTEDDFITSRV